MHTENLVIVLGLAPLERNFSLLEFAAKGAHVSVAPFMRSLLNSTPEIPYRRIVLLKVQLDARSCAEGFERCRDKHQRCLRICKRLLILLELQTSTVEKTPLRRPRMKKNLTQTYLEQRSGAIR